MISGTGFFTTQMSFHHPTNGVEALKETQGTYLSEWPWLILSSSTIGLLTDGILVLCSGSVIPVL